MKLSISVPDDLWASVHTDTSSGPSDTVQRALRHYADHLRGAERPLANAPLQSDLDRYRPAFEKAVTDTADGLRKVLDNGYQFGLLIAGGLTGVDFDLLDRPAAAVDIQRLVAEWGDGSDTEFSYDFCGNLENTLNAISDDGDDRDQPEQIELKAMLDRILGDEGDEGTVGVRWAASADSDGRLRPNVSTTYAQGIVRALRDVRDEVVRRLAQSESLTETRP